MEKLHECFSQEPHDRGASHRPTVSKSHRCDRLEPDSPQAVLAHAAIVAVVDRHERRRKMIIEKLSLRSREAAQALGISERTLWSLCQRNEIPHVKTGRVVLFPIASLKQWLEEKTKRPLPQSSDVDGGAE